MVAYIVAAIEVTAADAYETYKAQVMPTLEKYGGEFVVRGGAMEVLEGACRFSRLVVIKFPTVAHAKRWYDSPEYAGPKALRRSASRSVQIVVEGLEDGA